MRIKDLAHPITAAKADWLAGTSWLGFTPSDSSGNARERCRAVINSQMGNGYVIEYATLKYGDPNPGFESSPKYIQGQAAHRELAGKLIAVHKLRPSPRPLQEILGEFEYNQLQDMWAEGNRHRWSVAFPIVETYRIITTPFARDILGAEAMQRLFGHPSATLRPLNDDERARIADLEIEPLRAENAWIGIADEIAMAERSQISSQLQNQIDRDLALSAMEGMTEEQKRKIRKRAAWLAERYARQRTRESRLLCDDCGFDPQSRTLGTGVKPRSILDVHHKNPLDEGVRVTTLSDFCLLCPNCHRFAHALARSSAVSIRAG